MAEHVRQECSDRDCGGSCNYCNLFCCVNCCGFEGSLPTECPGEPMGAERADEVYAGKIDFIDGEWKTQKVRWRQQQEEAVRQAEERRRARL